MAHKPRSICNFPGIFKSRIKRIDSGYKLIEFLSGRRGSADTVVNVATVEFRFGTGRVSVCGLSLHQGSTESRKTLEQKFIF